MKCYGVGESEAPDNAQSSGLGYREWQWGDVELGGNPLRQGAWGHGEGVCGQW